MFIYPYRSGQLGLDRNTPIGELNKKGQFVVPLIEDGNIENTIATFALLPDDFLMRIGSDDVITVGDLRRQLRDWRKKNTGPVLVASPRNRFYSKMGIGGGPQEDDYLFSLSIETGITKALDAVFHGDIARPWRVELESLKVVGSQLRLRLSCCSSIGNFTILLKMYRVDGVWICSRLTMICHPGVRGRIRQYFLSSYGCVTSKRVRLGATLVA